MSKREISKVVVGSRQVDGAGVKLVRVIGYDNVHDFDPFLMLDAFDSSNSEDYIKGFPWHPHRGIETVTYLVQGEIEHGDSMGNKGTINDGCCQWMDGRKSNHSPGNAPAFEADAGSAAMAEPSEEGQDGRAEVQGHPLRDDSCP